MSAVFSTEPLPISVEHSIAYYECPNGMRIVLNPEGNQIVLDSATWRVICQAASTLSRLTFEKRGS